MIIALNNNNVEAGNNEKTPDKAKIQIRKKGKFAKTNAPERENKKLQKMNNGLAKQKLVFEDLDNSGEEDKPCMKKRVTCSMEVTILVAKRHMHII